MAAQFILATLLLLVVVGCIRVAVAVTRTQRRRSTVVSVEKGSYAVDAELEAQLLGELAAAVDVPTTEPPHDGHEFLKQTPSNHPPETRHIKFAIDCVDKRAAALDAMDFKETEAANGPTETIPTERPLFVNAKQVYRILKRREARAKLESYLRHRLESKRTTESPRVYGSFRRPRNAHGRFLTAAEIESLREGSVDESLTSETL